MVSLQMAAFATGTLFIAFQSAAYAGWIPDSFHSAVVKKVSEKALEIADVNHDGKVDLNDMVYLWKK